MRKFKDGEASARGWQAIAAAHVFFCFSGQRNGGVQKVCTRSVTSLRRPFSCNIIVTNVEVRDTDFLDTPIYVSSVLAAVARQSGVASRLCYLGHDLWWRRRRRRSRCLRRPRVAGVSFSLYYRGRGASRFPLRAPRMVLILVEAPTMTTPTTQTPMPPPQPPQPPTTTTVLHDVDTKNTYTTEHDDAHGDTLRVGSDVRTHIVQRRRDRALQMRRLHCKLRLFFANQSVGN